jgi:hypothetical protein
MIQYIHIEDFLEALAGYEYHISQPAFHFTNYPPAISLARYDTTIVESMASQTRYGGALTDKQADLVVRLILKYRKQFTKLGIDITPAETPQYRKPVRIVNREKRIWLSEEYISLRFPYDLSLIKEVQAYRNSSQGKMRFDSNDPDKAWHLAITEANVNWAVTFGKMYGFDIDITVQNLNTLVTECEEIPYEIKLVHDTETGFTITNAAASLLDYVNSELGGFGIDNVIALIDNAGVLGYTYDTAIVYPALLGIFNMQRNIHLPATTGALSLVLDYAALTNRYPVCIYDPSMSVADIDLSRFDSHEIVRFNHSGKTKTCDYNIDCVKVVYANKIPKTWDYPIPLLVSTAEMMFGGKRMEWINKAEKIVYCTNTKLREPI